MIRQPLSRKNLPRESLPREPLPCEPLLWELMPRQVAQPSPLPSAVAVNEVV